MVTALVIGLGVVLVVVWFAMRVRRYRRIFGDPHLLEINRGLAGVKAAALAQVMHDEGGEPASAKDRRILATSAGLAIVYTVSEREHHFVHHCSVSVIGGSTTHAVGGTFVLFVAELLGLARAELTCQVSGSGVHHAELELDAERHARLAAQPVPDLGLAQLVALRQQSLSDRSGVLWRTVHLDPAASS